MSRFAVDFRGRFFDNIFIDRRAGREVRSGSCLHEFRDGLDTVRIIETWVDSCDEVRSHSSLGRTRLFTGITGNDVFECG